MFGCETSSPRLMDKIFWKFWMNVTARQPPALHTKLRTPTGSHKSRTQPWPTRSWIAWFTMPIGFNWLGNRKEESYEHFGSCRTLDVQLSYRRVFLPSVRHATVCCAISAKYALTITVIYGGFLFDYQNSVGWYPYSLSKTLYRRPEFIPVHMTRFVRDG
jgi:hypothetical protein